MLIVYTYAAMVGGTGSVECSPTPTTPTPPTGVWVFHVSRDRKVFTNPPAFTKNAFLTRLTKRGLLMKDAGPSPRVVY